MKRQEPKIETEDFIIMEYTRQQLDELYESGRMPGRAYFAQVDMEPWKKKEIQRQKFIQDIMERRAREAEAEAAARKVQEEKKQEAELKKQIEAEAKKAIVDMLKGLNGLK